MNNSEIKKTVRLVKDFPKTGVSFIDISTALEDAKVFYSIIDKMAEMTKGLAIDKIVGLDARGFIFASALAYKLGKGLVIARKKGKLPFKTISCPYGLEYGKDELEIHVDSILEGENVLIVDDVLATGGTVEACEILIEELEANIVASLFFAEVEELQGRGKLSSEKIYSFLKY
mgnify:CR=1 FL=1